MPPPVSSAPESPALSPDERPETGSGHPSVVIPSRRGGRSFGLDALLLGLVVAVAAWMRLQFVATGAPTFVTPDSDDYLRPAYELAHGLGFNPELRRTPLYPMFIGVVLRAGGDLGTLASSQHLLGVLTVAATYGLGRATYGPLAGLLAGLGVALSGPLLIYEHYLMAEALFTLLLTSALLLSVLGLRRGTTGWLVGAGAALGLAALTRPVGQAAFPVVLGLSIVLALPDWRRGLRQCGLIACGVVLVMTPWLIRNLAVHGTAGTEGALGQALIGRTVRHDSGFRYDDPSRPDQDPTRAAARRIIQDESDGGEPSGGTITARVREELGLTQAQTSALLRDLALDAIAQRPGYFVSGSLETAWKLFGGVNDRLTGHWRQRTTRNWDRRWEPELAALLDRETPAEGPAYEKADGLTSTFQPWRSRWTIMWLFGIGAVAGLVFRRWRFGLLPAAMALVLVLAAATLDGLVWRFRYPVDPAIAVVAAGGIAAPVWLIFSAFRRYGLGRVTESATGE
jgi:4-amino-4-deoxy-L-arabinose transferase-like glycosyltransferase